MTCCSYCGKPRVVSHNWTSLWSQSRIDSLCSMDDASMAGKEGRRGGKEARREREGDELGTGALRLLADLDSLRLSQSERRQQPRPNSAPRRLSPCPGASLPATRDWRPPATAPLLGARFIGVPRTESTQTTLADCPTALRLTRTTHTPSPTRARARLLHSLRSRTRRGD